MYNLRDEAQKRGVNIGWDPKTQNVNVGQHSLTPQQLTGMGGQNTQGRWQLPEQALSNLLGGSAQQPTTPVQNNPLQYKPLEIKQYDAPKPDYDQYFGRALSEAMANREPLAQKAVSSVDENMAARGLYRSGVRESAATNAVAELEVALRNLAQQQAMQQYGMSLDQYNQEASRHMDMQRMAVDDNRFGQSWNRDNFLDERNFGVQQDRFARADEQWEQDFESDKWYKEQNLANEMRSLGLQGARLSLDRQRLEQEAGGSDEMFRGFYGLINDTFNQLPADFPTQERAKPHVTKVVTKLAHDISQDVNAGLITPQEGQKLMQAVEGNANYYLSQFGNRIDTTNTKPISGNPYIPDNMLID